MTTRFGPSFQRFLQNSAAQTFGQAVNALAQIFSVPAFLHFWTKTEWGEWLVITSIPALLWTLDGGLSGLAGNRMTVASGSGDWARANVIFHNVLFVQGLLSLAILLLAGWYVTVGNVSATFGFTLMSRNEAGEVLFIMIIYMLFGYGLGLLRAVFRASMLEARGVSLFNFNRLSEFGVQMIILACHGHMVALATGMLANMCFWCVAGFIDTRIRCRQIHFALWPISGPQMRSMLVDGVPVFAGTAAGAFFLQGYPLIVNATLGPVTVVTLTTIRTGSRTLLQMVGIVSNASTSELSRTYGSKDWEGYLRLLKVLAAATLWASIGAAVGLGVAGPWIIAKWTSLFHSQTGQIMVSHRIMLLFGLSIACQCAWSACGTILFSVNMHHAFNYAYLALTVIGLAVSTYAVHLLGFAGIPTVMMIVDAVLLGLAVHLCRTKLEFVPLSSLAKVVYPSFYLEKAQGVLRHVKSRTASGVAP